MKEEERRHGSIFDDEEAVKKILWPGEKAILIKKKNGKLELYGEPTREDKEIEYLKVGAEELYRDKKVEIIVLSARARMLPY